MYPNNKEKVIRINFAVELNVLIMGIIELKKYLEKKLIKVNKSCSIHRKRRRGIKCYY